MTENTIKAYDHSSDAQADYLDLPAEARGAIAVRRRLTLIVAAITALMCVISAGAVAALVLAEF